MMRTLFLAAMFASGAAQAQFALPPLQVPLPSVPASLPRVQLPVDVDKAVAETSGTLDTERLIDLRALRVRELIRKHRDSIEADPRGAAIVRAEVLAFSPSAATLEAAGRAGFTVVREQSLDGLDASIVVLRAPTGMATRRALARLKKIDPKGEYDFNHIYTQSGISGGKPAENGRPADHAQPANDAPEGSTASKIGLLDGGVELRHAVFREGHIYSHGCNGRPVPSAHGTAVASLLVGRAGEFHGVAAGTALYAADVYCGKPTGGAVDTIAEALAWMSREKVPVINISLVGPPNITLERVIRVVIARGHLVVAAVGNDGPAAAPLFPAAYPGVVGVTGVDDRRKVLLEACRGAQVDFAAPGADMAAASTPESYASVRGTSFAAPLVAGLLAQHLTAPDRTAAAQAVAALIAQAADLGAPGPDATYGNGLVGFTLRIPGSVVATLRGHSSY